MKKAISLLTLFIAIQIHAFSQAPKNYYQAAEGKKDQALKTALFNTIGGPTVTSYKGLWTAFRDTDRRPDGKVWDIYSNTTNYVFGTDQCGNYKKEGDCYNREHSFPKSWFKELAPMYSDLYHLYPSDGYVNGRRGNDAFGEVKNASYTSHNGYSKSGSSNTPGYNGQVFEPNDEIKGDMARTYFYMVTAYEPYVEDWSSPHTNNSYLGLNNWSIDLLLKWHRQDPVSPKEIDRNNSINYGHQSNRNPFIDYPELVEHIWGNKKGQVWNSVYDDTPRITSPSNNAIDFGDIAVGYNTNMNVSVLAQHLTGGLTLSISDDVSNSFSISTTSISKNSAHAGYDLTVSCNPQTSGLIEANLKISGGGAELVVVPLKAYAIDNLFVALPATDIKSNGFTANWTESAGATSYLLDVYKYANEGSASEIILEEDFSDGFPEDWSKEGYADIEQGELRMASGKQDGVVIIPNLDLSEPTVLAINMRRYGNDANPTLKVELNNQIIANITATAENDVYELSVPAKISSSTLKLTAIKNKRIIISSILIKTEGEEPIVEHVYGYPKDVGYLLNYEVEGLSPEQFYYYTVAPQGNATSISNEVQVKTSTSTSSNEMSDYSTVYIYAIRGELFINHIQAGYQVNIYNIVGERVKTELAQSSQMSISVSNKGVYIVQVMDGNRIIDTQKIIIN